MSYREDVIIVANALIHESVEWSDYDGGYFCIYCYNGYQDYMGSYKHNLNCPILVARDLLTVGK